MRFHALACDYDGTIARDGRVPAEVVDGLKRVRESGRRVILVTGRQMDDLVSVFSEVTVFDRVVAENGGVLYDPTTQQAVALGEAPPPEFDERLRRRGVANMARGHVIVATWRPHEAAVLETIQEMGLELQVIFNKDAVMVLPSGINKATGLAYALHQLQLSPHNTVGIGDAENDHAFLALCEASVAVANALPAIKERADWTTAATHGAGALELIDELVADDLATRAAALTRRFIPIGTLDDGRELAVPPYGENLLLAGTSGSGKSTLTTAFLEALAERGYQFCIIDPEGDYDQLSLAATLGDQNRAPTADEVLELLQAPDQHVVVNMLGLPMSDRPSFFAALLPRLQELRARTARPHWLIVDEAHHLFPESWVKTGVTLPLEMQGLLLVTVHPEHVSRTLLGAVQRVVAIGESLDATLRGFAEGTGHPPPVVETTALPAGEALTWAPGRGEPPAHIRTRVPHTERRRHKRKYAEGELAPDRSFYFEGPAGKLHLRAQNLQLFLQIADGVDDETWMHHLRRGDYSRWFREMIKDPALADEAAQVEAQPGTSPRESRDQIRALVEQRYTAPA